MKRFLVAFFRLFLRVFYRRVEVLGLDRVPVGRGVVFAVNHPNGLVDPLFVLCHAPRDVSFLAKAPLFRYPVVGWFARKLDSIPVYRKQDVLAGSNRETFRRARAILAAGGGVAIFPEGTTHNDTQLRQLKTGAARIALGSVAGEGVAFGGMPPVIVPAGIYYAEKETFRSDALVSFGSPIEVPVVPLDADDEPPPDAVRSLTAAIDGGLDRVTLQVESDAALDLVERAEDIFSASDPPKVAAEFTLRRRFVAGYRYLCEHDRPRLARLENAIREFTRELDEAGVEPHELIPRFRFLGIVGLLALTPFAIVGAVLHYPTYRLVGSLGRRIARREIEMVATMKFIAALLFFPVTWLVYALVAGRLFGVAAALATFLAVPLLGWIALRTGEKLSVTFARAKMLSRAERRKRLVRTREAIRDDFLAVAEEMAEAGEFGQRPS